MLRKSWLHVSSQRHFWSNTIIVHYNASGVGLKNSLNDIYVVTLTIILTIIIIDIILKNHRNGICTIVIN